MCGVGNATLEQRESSKYVNKIEIMNCFSIPELITMFSYNPKIKFMYWYSKIMTGKTTQQNSVFVYAGNNIIFIENALQCSNKTLLCTSFYNFFVVFNPYQYIYGLFNFLLFNLKIFCKMS